MRTTYGAAYAASKAIDGDIRSLAASGVLSAANDEWISVQMPAGATIDYVAVYNRDDYTWATAFLNPYELWLTAAPGTVTVESSTAHRCGAGLVAPGLGPYMTWCGARSDLPYVTLIVRAAAAPPTRLLSLGELMVYGTP